MFCANGAVTSTAYETLDRTGPLPLKTPQPTVSELAGLCLQYLAENPEQLAEFMGVSGLSPDGLRGNVGGASLNRGLIDYFVQNEPLLLAFCANSELAPEAVMRVWARLNPAG